ncbi:MAG: family 43 glycosylhydrolase [Anaerolineales bacterium]|nr:family 43 glycosylhydrolase [Anaerolineales bacterium]
MPARKSRLISSVVSSILIGLVFFQVSAKQGEAHQIEPTQTGASWQDSSSSRILVSNPSCQNPGWFPDEFGLKDHTVFWHAGYYYIASIYLPNEKQFAYGRSADLCDWEILPPILSERIPGTWDESNIWAPFVYEEEGVYYMFYTGVNHDRTQSIMLATSSDPSDPGAWEVQGLAFQPDHPDMIWAPNSPADCRDPSIVKTGEVYYLFYSAVDQGGGIVGVATSTTLSGAWYDWGAIFPPTPDQIPESSIVYYHSGFYYLLHHYPSSSETYRIGASPTGPWTDQYILTPGWAHEIWDGPDNSTYASFLTDYTVTIRPVLWNTRFYPARIFLGSEIYFNNLPIISRTTGE